MKKLDRKKLEHLVMLLMATDAVACVTLAGYLRQSDVSWTVIGLTCAAGGFLGSLIGFGLFKRDRTE